MTQFSERIKMIRKASKLTQKQLAKESGLSERGVQNYELGERVPTLQAAIALADFFDVSLDYLVGRTDNPEVNR